MKITNKLKAEILSVYNAYWDNYLEGDVEAMTVLLADEYTQVGSADTEVFYTKKDAVNFLYETIDQVAGKLEMRNRSTRLEQQDNLILIHELCDLYVLADDKWAFYAKARASTLMQKKKEGWKIIHQHSSFPDARTGDGENIAIDKIAEENRELREAVKRRTVELEQKNRELEIETALEKVRSSALAMKVPADMVAVCRIISDQLQTLGIANIRNVQTAIINEQKSSYLNYQYFTSYNKSTIEEAEYNKHPKAREMAETMKRSANASYSQSFNGKDLDVFRQYRKHDNQFPDPILDESTSLHFYFYSIGPGALGLSTYNFTLSENELNILKRFRNVFELAYRRFIDIELAIAQAREAKIEAALEKVRAVAMGMREPADMLDVCKTISLQLQSLGVKEIRNVQTAIFYEQRGTYMNYEFYAKHDKTFITETVYTNNKIHNEFATKMLMGKGETFITHIKGDEVKDWIAYQKTTNVFIDKYLEIASSLNYYWFSLGPVALGISTYIPLTEDEINLFKRFLKVFELAYQRYLDIEKAESQAREAKIEVSLERVRSKAMAMHSPNDLSETVNVFFKELKTLGIIPIRCGVGQIDGATRTTSLTTTTSSQQGESFQVIGKVKQTGHPVLDGIFDHWKPQQEYHPVLEGEDIKAYYDVMNPQIGYPEYPGGVTQYGNCFFFKEGFVFAWTESKLSEEELIIFRRFTSVLSLTYRRYMDLKEAEEKNKIIRADNDRKTKELEEARQLQLSLLPKSVPRLPRLEIAVYMKTATEVGGDYYDFNVQENGVLNLGFGDATGHGLQAGTMITLMKGFFTSDAARFSPQKFLEHCNSMIRDIKLGRILMSFSHLRFENNRLIISSAGMPPVYYYHKKNNRIEEIIIQGMPLGAMQSSSYKIVEKELNGGDTILLLTDGLPEQMNSNKVIFDYSRVLKYFGEIAENTPDEIIKGLVKKADEWMDGASQTDDITFVVIKIK